MDTRSKAACSRGVMSCVDCVDMVAPAEVSKAVPPKPAPSRLLLLLALKKCNM